jgi:hypothetical protein
MGKTNGSSSSEESPVSGGGAGYADGDRAAPAPGPSLPTIRTSLDAAEILSRLEKRSRKGRLAGYRQTGARSFELSAFGAPYDKALVGTIDERAGAGSEIAFELRTLWKLPAAMGVMVVVMFWPGVWLTDSLGSTYFGWWPRNFWITAAWYLPLCALALPVVWKQWKSSGVAAGAHARETVGELVGLVEGREEAISDE